MSPPVIALPQNVPVRAATTRSLLCPVSVTTMLPNRSRAAPHAWANVALAAGPPSPSGPTVEPVPAGVVSQSVWVLTSRTAASSAISRWTPR